MPRLFVAILLAVVALAPGCAPSTIVTSSNVQVINTDVARKLIGAVFEVVVPVVEDAPGTKYAVPLPYDLLPFAERNQKFVGIGTAFAIAPTKFVTAAHLMPLMETGADRFYLRDAQGATYEVGRILKYSMYRDLVEFELASPMNVTPLETREDVTIGFDQEHKEMLADWSFSAPLPDSLPSLRASARRSFFEFEKARYAIFDA
jgi:hypothetical protein